MKKHFREYFLVTLGNLILAIAVASIIVPGKILSGGISGIAIALYPILKLPIEYMIYFLQVSLFVLGAFVLGRKFVAKTLYSTVIYTVFLAIITENKWIIHIENPMIASIYGGIGVGIGVGLVFREGASTGGVDILALIGAKYTSVTLSTWVLIIDSLTVILGITTYGFEQALVGIISVYTCTVAIDKILMLGANESISLLIISDFYEKIVNEIHTTFDRGCTILNAVGAYSRQDKPVVMVVLDKKEYPIVQKRLKEIDPNSFTIVQEIKEVHGEGFLQEII